MAQNLVLDPTIKDYVISNGSSIPTDSVLEKCYYALMVPQSRYLYGINNQGSLLWKLEKSKRNSTLEQNFSSYTTDAIKRQVIDTNDATKQQIRNLAATRTNSSNQVNVVPAQVQVSTQFNFVPV